MDYQEAVKAAKSAAKTKDYMMININYKKFIVLHDQGIAMLSALKNAEKFDGSEWNNQQIVPITGQDIEFSLLSEADYLAHKVAMLLGITVDEAKTLAKENKTVKDTP